MISLVLLFDSINICWVLCRQPCHKWPTVHFGMMRSEAQWQTLLGFQLQVCDPILRQTSQDSPPPQGNCRIGFPQFVRGRERDTGLCLRRKCMISSALNLHFNSYQMFPHLLASSIHWRRSLSESESVSYWRKHHPALVVCPVRACLPSVSWIHKPSVSCK